MNTPRLAVAALGLFMTLVASGEQLSSSLLSRATDNHAHRRLSLNDWQQGGRPVKIYIYQHPPHIPMWDSKEAHWEQRSMEAWVRGSKHYTADGAEADFFWIPLYKAIGDLSATLDVFRHIRTQHPYWNRTADCRHILVTSYDTGPGDVFHESRLDMPGVPADINPASPTRKVMFLNLNGLRDGADSGQSRCWVCFQKNKDIMLPGQQGVCGPLCGYTKAALTAKSLWSRNTTGARGYPPRKHLLFYGGQIGDRRADDFSGRGAAYALYRNRTDYLIVNTAPPDSERVDFSDAMRGSHFCYSPFGGIGGPTDRYMAALMFGCIPVFLSHSKFHEPLAKPFDEVIPWQLFSVSIAFHDLNHLDTELRKLLPHVGEMRRHMSRFVRPLLYSSRYGSYFGEPPDGDAMATLMRVLELRLRRSGGWDRGTRGTSGTNGRLSKAGQVFTAGQLLQAGQMRSPRT